MMQNLKVLSLAHRSFLFKYPARAICISKYIQYNGHMQCDNRSVGSHASLARLKGYEDPFRSVNSVTCYRYKQLSSDQDKNVETTPPEGEVTTEKLTLFQRYKKMLKEYWYVLIPVHMISSAIWFGGFYYAATCGIDIVPFLELINLPEFLIEPLRTTALGHIAVASALYKLATPARYMVTLGGTSFAVKFFKKRGLIRPAPTKAEIKTIIQKKLKKDVDK